jgi:hypothetical protein
MLKGSPRPRLQPDLDLKRFFKAPQKNGCSYHKPAGLHRRLQRRKNPTTHLHDTIANLNRSGITFHKTASHPPDAQGEQATNHRKRKSPASHSRTV